LFLNNGSINSVLQNYKIEDDGQRVLFSDYLKNRKVNNG